MKNRLSRNKVATRLAHAGRHPERHSGTVNPPVYHASTILFSSLADWEAATADPFAKDNFSYGRGGSPTSFALAEAVAELEGGYGAIVVSSGLAAITAAIMAFVESGDEILVSDCVYYPNHRFCETMLQRFGVKTSFFDPLIGAGIAGLITPKTKLIFVESPGSHSFEIQDLPAIASAARAADVAVIVDNTWASPLFCQPLALGAQVSIHAGTKYIVGHSDAMLGIIVTDEAHYRRLRKTVGYLGHHAGPDDVYLGLRGLRTLGVRLARHQENGLALARWLQGRPEVLQVMHPGLESDPSHHLWKRDFSGASGLFGVLLKPASKQAFAAMLDGLELFGLGASWGGYESLALPANPRLFRQHWPLPAEGQVLRLHAGLEDPQDLIADLEAGFDRLRSASPLED